MQMEERRAHLFTQVLEVLRGVPGVSHISYYGSRIVKAQADPHASLSFRLYRPRTGVDAYAFLVLFRGSAKERRLRYVDRPREPLDFSKLRTALVRWLKLNAQAAARNAESRAKRDAEREVEEAERDRRREEQEAREGAAERALLGALGGPIPDKVSVGCTTDGLYFVRLPTKLTLEAAVRVIKALEG